jgi:hypothetical protein
MENSIQQELQKNLFLSFKILPIKGSNIRKAIIVLWP